MTKKRILLIEDEMGLGLTLSDLLEGEGYATRHEPDGEDGYRAALRGVHDLIVLDLMLPGKGGLDICRGLRQNGIATPILMLTARDELVDKVVGLKMGADDYLTKPFENMELLARIEALLRRGSGVVPDSAVHRFGEVRVDLRSAEVVRAGVAVHLSAREYQLLHYFLQHPDELLSRDRLIDEVWGYDASAQTRTVDVYVANLRQKLEQRPSRPRFIQTIHGMGYKFKPDR